MKRRKRKLHPDALERLKERFAADLVHVASENARGRFVACPRCGQKIGKWCGPDQGLHQERIDRVRSYFPPRPNQSRGHHRERSFDWIEELLAPIPVTA